LNFERAIRTKSKSRTLLTTLPLLACILHLGAHLLFAQQNLGRIEGTVTDPTGSVVPDAIVKARSVETGGVTEVKTNTAGAYYLPTLSIGEYVLTVEASGFKSLERPSVRIVAGVTLTIDLQLEIGNTSQTVTVSTAAAKVDTSSDSTGTTRVSEEISELPLLGVGVNRSVVSFLRTLPGVPTSVMADNAFNSTGVEVSPIDGAPGGSQSYTVDGVRGNVSGHGQLRDDFQPPPEAVEEMRLSSSGETDVGWNSGVGLAIILKSGTNHLHGNLFEYVINTKLNARNFFSSSVSPQQQNEFGFTLGGPVVIPHLYNGKNKTFFFGMYSGFRYRTVTAGLITSVPTALMREGNFSQWLGSQVGTDALNRPVYQGEIFDPATTRTVNGATLRDPFMYNGQLNVIDPSRVSSLSMFFQPGYPLPTGPGVFNNWVGNGDASPVTTNKGMVKIDHEFANGRQKISAAWDEYRNHSISGGVPMAAIISPDTGTDVQTDRGRLIYQATLGSNKVIAFRMAANVNSTGLNGDPNPTEEQGGKAAGLTGTFYPGTPLVNLQNYQGFGSYFAGYFNAPDWTVPINTDLAWTIGSHNLKIGAEFLNNNIELQYCDNCSGNYSFANVETGQPTFPQTGASYASFLLGAVDSSTISTPSVTRWQSSTYGIYAQDTWRLTPKLTLSYGLRWDLFHQEHEEHSRISIFDPTIPNPAAGGHLGAMSFFGTGPGRNGRYALADPQNAWSGRFGISYALNRKTVIRGSYGLASSNVYGVFSSGLSLPFAGGSAQSTWVGSTASLNAGVTPAFIWSTAYPLTAPPLPSFNPSISNGTLVPIWDQNNLRPARCQLIDVGIERELPASIIVKADYVGNLEHGVMISNQYQYQLPLSDLQLGNLLLQDINSPAAQAAGIQVPYAGFSGPVSQALVPFPQYTGVQDLATPGGYTEYNSFQLAVQRHVGHDLTFLLSYTISKNLGNVGPNTGSGFDSGENALIQHYDLRVKEGKWVSPAPYYTEGDRPQDLSISYVYQLPFGRGKRFANTNNPVIRQLVSGWQLTAVHEYVSGLPVNITTNDAIPGNFGMIWANRIPNVPITTSNGCGNYDPGNPAKNTYLNIAAFADPAPFTLGNTNVLPHTRNCGWLNENYSLQKNVRVSEHANLLFSVDVSNIFNRHIWGQGQNGATQLQTDIDVPQTFGTFTGASNPRLVQLHAKLEF